MIKSEKVSRGSTLSIAIGTIVLSIILLSGGASALDGGITWHVLAGGETPDMALQGMGFYPGNITINEGDTINWTLGGHLVHTVSFLSGAPVPDPGSPEVLLPAGGSTYNGTGVVSSGLLLPGMNYSLTFTKQGFYAYRCLIHPGMAGVVIVQPAGSPYPANQAQYTAKGMNELQMDIDTGQKLANNLSLKTTPGTNGTTVFHTSIDIPLPVNASLLLLPKNNSNVTGNATLNFIDIGKLQVQIMVSGLVPNSTHPAHIHVGTSAEGGPILYPLNNVTADINGIGTSTTVITGPPWFAIASRGWFINVHQGPTMEGIGATPISSGDIVKHDAMFARFTPENLTIHANDQVEWTHLNPMEIHTVTFPEAGNEPPEFLLPNLTVNPVAATPAGGSIHNGTGFYNSGILNPGDNYTLTFTKPGTYDYVCVVHDNMNMVGEVVVLPQGGVLPQGETISGFKINGTDNNGMGIENWNIMLLNDKGAQIASTTTDSMGFYNFTGLTNGTYNVTEGMRAGWTNTSTSPMSRIVTLNGTDKTNVNFTNMLLSPTPVATFTISGFKINDTNGNGVWNPGEMGIPNWKIMLLNDTGVQLANTSTNAQGFYQFMNIFPGKYNIAEEIKPGFTPTNATSIPVTVENMDVMNVNFTNTPVPPTPTPLTGSISGNVINVATGMGIPNVTIRLVGIVGMGVDTKAIRMETMTDSMGKWMFDNLQAGKYIIIEQLPKGFIPVAPPVMNIMLAQGQNSMNNNFTVNPISALVPSVPLPPVRTS